MNNGSFAPELKGYGAVRAGILIVLLYDVHSEDVAPNGRWFMLCLSEACPHSRNTRDDMKHFRRTVGGGDLAAGCSSSNGESSGSFLQSLRSGEEGDATRMHYAWHDSAPLNRLAMWLD